MHWSVKILAFIYDSGRCAVSHMSAQPPGGSQLSFDYLCVCTTESAPLDRSETQHRRLASYGKLASA